MSDSSRLYVLSHRDRKILRWKMKRNKNIHVMHISDERDARGQRTLHGNRCEMDGIALDPTAWSKKSRYTCLCWLYHGHDILARWPSIMKSRLLQMMNRSKVPHGFVCHSLVDFLVGFRIFRYDWDDADSIWNSKYNTRKPVGVSRQRYSLTQMYFNTISIEKADVPLQPGQAIGLFSQAPLRDESPSLVHTAIYLDDHLFLHKIGRRRFLSIGTLQDLFDTYTQANLWGILHV